MAVTQKYLDTSASSTTGAIVAIPDSPVVVQVVIETSSTVALQASSNASNWATLRTITASEIVTFHEPHGYIRCTETSASGASTVIYLTTKNGVNGIPLGT